MLKLSWMFKAVVREKQRLTVAELRSFYFSLTSALSDGSGGVPLLLFSPLVEASSAGSRADKYSKYTAQSGESGPGLRYLNFYRQSAPPGETGPGVTLELPDQREPARTAAPRTQKD